GGQALLQVRQAGRVNTLADPLQHEGSRFRNWVLGAMPTLAWACGVSACPRKRGHGTQHTQHRPSTLTGAAVAKGTARATKKATAATRRRSRGGVRSLGNLRTAR